MFSRKHTHCPLCRSERYEHFLLGFDRVFPRQDNFNYVKCLECGMVFLCPLPTSEEIASFYGEAYGPHQSGEARKIHRRHTSPLNRFLIRNYFSTDSEEDRACHPILYSLARLGSRFALKNIIHPHGKNRLLDVGCGSGEWLYQHHSIGWRAEGVEMNPRACEKARKFGIPVYMGTIDDVPAGKIYDIISFNHVIEHVPDPLHTLEKAKKLLAPGGLIYLLLPNLDSFGFERFQNCWFPLDPPRHVLQFSIETMKRLVEQCGLEIEHFRTEPKARFILKSLYYEKYLGRNFHEIKDLETRERLIRRCFREENTNSLKKRLLKKFFYLYTRFFFNGKNGEIMKLLLRKKQDTVSPLSDHETE